MTTLIDHLGREWERTPSGSALTHGHQIMAIDPAMTDEYLLSVIEDMDPASASSLAAAESTRIAMLWQAAHDYEFAQVSGSAIGLLAMGVMQGLPKCLAVQAWIKSIWTLYYTRKAMGEASTDFSSCGMCPYSVPELMAELGV